MNAGFARDGGRFPVRLERSVHCVTDDVQSNRWSQVPAAACGGKDGVAMSARYPCLNAPRPMGNDESVASVAVGVSSTPSQAYRIPDTTGMGAVRFLPVLN